MTTTVTASAKTQRCFRVLASLWIALLFTPMLAGCISISWTTEREAREQMQLVEAITSDKEIAFDASETLSRLASTEKQIETDLRYKHSRILSSAEVSASQQAELQRFLNSILEYAKQTAMRPDVIAAFSSGLSADGAMLSSTTEAKDIQAAAKQVSAQVVSDKSAKAFAFVDPLKQIPPRIVLSTALLRDLAKPDASSERLLGEIRSFRKYLDSLPKRDGLSVVSNYHKNVMNREMNLMTSNLGSMPAGREYIHAVLFVVAHELAHVLFDASDSPSSVLPWREARADLFGIFVSESLTHQARETNAANDAVLRGGFHTNDLNKLLTLWSDVGYEIFLNVYKRSNFTEGDATHLPIEERLKILKPAYEELFKRKAR